MWMVGFAFSKAAMSFGSSSFCWEYQVQQQTVVFLPPGDESELQALRRGGNATRAAEAALKPRNVRRLRLGVCSGMRGTAFIFIDDSPKNAGHFAVRSASRSAPYPADQHPSSHSATDEYAAMMTAQSRVRVDSSEMPAWVGSLPHLG